MSDEKMTTGGAILGSDAADTPKVAGGLANATVSDVFGQIVWLMTQSKSHQNFFLSDLEWMVMPALLLRQFRIFPGKTQPMGVALYAYLSEETEKRLEAGGTRIGPNEWKAGDRLWLLDLVAPFGHQAEMLNDLKTTIFAGKVFKMHGLTETGARKTIVVDPLADAPASPSVN